MKTQRSKAHCQMVVQVCTNQDSLPGWAEGFGVLGCRGHTVSPEQRFVISGSDLPKSTFKDPFPDCVANLHLSRFTARLSS